MGANSFHLEYDLLSEGLCVHESKQEVPKLVCLVKLVEDRCGHFLQWLLFVERIFKVLCEKYSIYIYSRLSLSRIPRDSLKYFEISVLRHFRFAELGGKLIRLTTFNKYMCNWTLEIRDILKILWKRGEIAPLEQFLLFSTIFFYLLSDFHV